MTAIAGFCDGTRVWIGGDSAGADMTTYSLTRRSDPKVFHNADFLFGFTTSFRMGQLLKYKLNPPIYTSGDIHRFMCTDFIDAVRTCLKDGGFASKDKETESGGTFLVGFRGRLFEIDGDYQVGESMDGYAAVGCGKDYALGAMWEAIRSAADDGESVIKSALGAATHHSAAVIQPFTILSV